MRYSLAPFIEARPWLYKMVKPIAKWYRGAAGYRQLGLRYVLLAWPKHEFPLTYAPVATMT